MKVLIFLHVTVISVLWIPVVVIIAHRKSNIMTALLCRGWGKNPFFFGKDVANCLSYNILIDTDWQGDPTVIAIFMILNGNL